MGCNLEGREQHSDVVGNLGLRKFQIHQSWGLTSLYPNVHIFCFQ